MDDEPGKLELVQGLFGRFSGRSKRDSAQILTHLAPQMMTPKMINSSTVSRSRQSIASQNHDTNPFATLGRAPLRLGLGSRRVTSRDLQIFEATEELLDSDLPENDGGAGVSLLRGFNATIPSADVGKSRRRQMRNVDVPKMGLKRLGMSARGLMAEDVEQEGQLSSDDDVVIVGGSQSRPTRAGKRRPRESLSASKVLGRDELARQAKEISRDKENLHVKRSLLSSEIAEITHKIEALDAIRSKLEQDLIKLQEDDLELEDELAGVQERLQFEEAGSKDKTQNHYGTQSSRRRKGPAFLPSEHDDLPPGVAFMSLEGHATPITSLDLSEPYGLLVSASQEESQPHVWDLMTGVEIGRLKGHRGTVKCTQVEDSVCVTGAEDGAVRLWDLRKVGDSELPRVVEEEEELQEEEDGELVQHPNGIRNGQEDMPAVEQSPASVRVLEGHSKSVTALYFEDDCLVTGASDKTLRQWDLATGQCVMTMDILWAISHPNTTSSGNIPHNLFPGAAAASGAFAVPTPPFSDGSWEMYQDFVGGVQFWGYGLVSGSGDGAVRMWDMRTGQAHRTLLGHTSPVTCLQFDEIHIVSGSLDKSIRIWDVRMGSTFETLKYDHPVTSLQFDSRKIVAATGENGIKVYNRTSMQQSTLLTNGHTMPVERLRYMDRYMVTGGRDATVKVWSL